MVEIFCKYLHFHHMIKQIKTNIQNLYQILLFNQFLVVIIFILINFSCSLVTICCFLITFFDWVNHYKKKYMVKKMDVNKMILNMIMDKESNQKVNRSIVIIKFKIF